MKKAIYLSFLMASIMLAVVLLFRIYLQDKHNTERNAEPACWEYKVITNNSVAPSDFYSRYFFDPTEELNKAGLEGWELVGVYTTTETVFPNYGNDKYVTGIRDNVRTGVMNFVLKRPVKKQPEKSGAESDSEPSDSIVNEIDAKEVATAD